MFESFCALLLRLYPAEFRDAYGPEAQQLMRDRARDERGLFGRIRLLIDLILDLGGATLHSWHAGKPLLAPIDGPPRFDIIGVHRPSPVALTVGMVVTTLMFTALTQVFQEPLTAVEFLSGRFWGKGQGGGSNHSPQQQQQTIARDREARHELVADIAANLKERYHDRAIGQHLSDALLAQDKSGAYDWLGVGASLAARLNADIQKASRRLDMPRGLFVADVVYIATPRSGPPAPMTEEAQARRRAMLLAQNCLIEKTETLPPRNVGYLKLNGFADVAACQETTVRAMASLNDASALIIDLRDNRGGFGETALLIAGYLFDRPAFLFDPRPNSPIPPRTASPVSGNKLADKPVYVLASSRTQSAAEYFVYNLKMLKRATIVGETTAGRQHSGGFHRLTDHFAMGIQSVAPPENPYPVKGWDVIGVEPDVTAPGAEALATAKRLAESR
jgi:class 3 adenylate cyclase